MVTKTERKNRRDCKRWTEEENQRLLRHVRARPQNLKFCFLMVAEEIGRTEGAVANHWYSYLSKRDGDSLCFFTASPKHVSRNRKNGEGTESTPSIWNKLRAILRSIHIT